MLLIHAYINTAYEIEDMCGYYILLKLIHSKMEYFEFSTVELGIRNTLWHSRHFQNIGSYVSWSISVNEVHLKHDKRCFCFFVFLFFFFHLLVLFNAFNSKILNLLARRQIGRKAICKSFGGISGRNRQWKGR